MNAAADGGDAVAVHLACVTYASTFQLLVREFLTRDPPVRFPILTPLRENRLTTAWQNQYAALRRCLAISPAARFIALNLSNRHNRHLEQFRSIGGRTAFEIGSFIIPDGQNLNEIPTFFDEADFWRGQ